jgi:hypothetical protein
MGRSRKSAANAIPVCDHGAMPFGYCTLQKRLKLQLQLQLPLPLPLPLFLKLLLKLPLPFRSR